jgi:hypothetical protein
VGDVGEKTAPFGIWTLEWAPCSMVGDIGN